MTRQRWHTVTRGGALIVWGALAAWAALLALAFIFGE